jgi:hydrogenase expression/formation protein HypE
MLGLEPLYLACEGRLVIVCPQEEAGRLLEILRGQSCTEGAALIGCITEENKGRVVMTTQIGAQTLLPEPGNELLPRIC